MKEWLVVLGSRLVSSSNSVSSSLRPLPTDAEWRSQVKLIVTDMDGTLTQQGKFTSELLRTFEQLQLAKIEVLVVTGRSAGWVSGLRTYLPIAGAIAENGGIYFEGDCEDSGLPLTPIGDFAQYREQLHQVFEQLKQEFPLLTEAADNAFRLTDWTFENNGLATDTLEQMANICEQMGWGFTYSAIQCHIKLQEQNKGGAVMKVLGDHFPHLSPQQIVTVGDSPNDETLFDPSIFPNSVGVANVSHYADVLQDCPQYVTKASEGSGFCEFVDWLLNLT